MKMRNIIFFTVSMFCAAQAQSWARIKTQAYSNEIVAVQQDQNGSETIITFAFTQDPICTYTPNAHDVNSVKRYFIPLDTQINDYILRSLGNIRSPLFDLQVQQSQGELPGLDFVFILAQGCSMRKVINHSTRNLHFIFTRV